MRLRESLALALLCACAIAQADPSDYGKVDTFQPGKKYNCVPTADRKGWDCRMSGAAQIPPAAAAEPEKPARSEPSAPASPPAQAAPRAGALPGYLAAPAQDNTMQAMPATPAPKPAPPPRVQGPMVPAQAPATAAAPPPAPPPQPATPAPEPASAVAAPPPTTSTPPVDFLALPADAYVIELARAATEAELAAPNPIGEKVYKLHLRQNEAEVWLLVCGPYDSLQAARTARDELVAQGATPGWPRRVGPLQTEVRRRQSF